MKKSLLVQMLVFFATTKEKYDLTYVDVLRHDLLSYDEDVDLWANHSSGAANTKIIKGKLVFGQMYLVSRGKEIGYHLKPSVVLEYSSHWPYEFCYLYKI